MLLAIPKTEPNRAQPEGGLGTPVLLPSEDALPSLPDGEYHLWKAGRDNAGDGTVPKTWTYHQPIKAKTPKQPETKITAL